MSFQDEDDRLTKMLGDLDRRYTGEDFSVNNNTDMVTKFHFYVFKSCEKTR
jgi:hypothetical protein